MEDEFPFVGACFDGRFIDIFDLQNQCTELEGWRHVVREIGIECICLSVSTGLEMW